MSIAEVTCRRCRTTAEVVDGSIPLGWSTTGPGGGDGPDGALCATCTREHVRDIEAKLDEEWWD